MNWVGACVLALLGLGLLHLWWRARFEAAEVAAQQKIENLRKAQEQAALELQARQEALFDSMVEGLVLLDQNGHIQMANRAFMALFDLTADVRTRNLMEALRLHELTDLVESLDVEKQVLGYELKLARPNERWVQVNGAAILDAAGVRQGTVLMFHDQTRIKRLERTRQEFVANVSHELRTPLSLIKGYAETLLDGAKNNPELASKFLQIIDRNAERLRLLIEDLLTISELESGRIKLNLQTVALKSAVAKVLADFKTRAEARQVILVDETPELTVRADADRLEQILCNLVDNGIKYGRQEGTLTISARAAEGEAEVSVKDDGPGIPAESLERVFERFYRVDKARSREQGGTGLGLSIVKHLVQAQGGRVWARSEVGGGTIFYFTLPQDSGGIQPALL